MFMKKTDIFDTCYLFCDICIYIKGTAATGKYHLMGLPGEKIAIYD